MSVDLCVFFSDAALPTRDEWQRVLEEEGTALVLDQFSPREDSGFLPATLNEEACGFEYSFGPITDEDFGDVRGELEEFGDFDRVVALTTHSNQLEGRAAMLAAGALAMFTGGVYFDPQGGNFVRIASVREFAAEAEAEERAWRMEQAVKKWGRVTDRHCPKCGAPCPEYKLKCAVCDYEIGRAVS